MNPKLLTSQQLALIRGVTVLDQETFMGFLEQARMSSTTIPQLYGTPEFVALAVKHGLLAPGSVLPWPPP